MKKILVPLVVVSCILMAMAPESSAQTWNPAAYSGYRCGLVAIREVKLSKNGIEFTADIANTGRFPLDLSRSAETGQEIVITADASLDASGLAGVRDKVAEAVLRSGLRIKPGQMMAGKRFRSVLKPLESDAPIVNAGVEVPLNGQAQDTSSTIQGCPDLVIDSLWIVSVRNYRIEFGWRVANLGQVPARLWERNEVGVSLGIYLGSGTRITRASEPVGLVSLKGGSKINVGVIPPRSSIVGQGRILLDHRRLPSQQVLQARLDPNGWLPECAENNNEFTIPLPERDQ